MERTTIKGPESFLVSSTLFIDQMRHKDELTDVILQCGKKNFPAHGIVLAATSAYFRELLCSSKSHVSKRHIRLVNVDEESIEQLLNFIYTGCLNLPDKPTLMRSLMLTAKTLRMNNFDRQLATIARGALNADNYGIFWKMASEFSNSDLECEVLSYVVNNFAKLCGSKRFQELPLAHVRMLYPRLQRLGFSSEMMLSSIIHWANAPSMEAVREKKIHTLMRFVKFKQLSTTYCENLLKNEPLAAQFTSLVRQINHILKLHKKSAEGLETPKTEIPPTPAMIGDGYRLKYTTVTPNEMKEAAEEGIVGEGERQNEKEEQPSTMETHAMFVREWLNNVSESMDVQSMFQNFYEGPTRTNHNTKKLRKQSSVHPGHRICGRVIMLIGKTPESELLLQHFSLQQYGWVETENPINALQQGSCNIPEGAVAVAANNLLYIIGGTDPATNESSRSVVVYNIKANKFWKEAKKMEEARTLAGCTFMSGSIYVLGGILIKRNQKASPLCSVERFNVTKNMWLPVASMPVPLWKMAVTYSEDSDSLYCFGGLDDMGYSNRCLTYSQRTNEWTILCQMLETFADTLSLAASVDNKILAFRCRNKTSSGSISIYDRRKDFWFSLKTTGTPPKDVLMVLPWRQRIFVIDRYGKIYPFNMLTSQWEQESMPCTKTVIPMYAAVLQRL